MLHHSPSEVFLLSGHQALRVTHSELLHVGYTTVSMRAATAGISSYISTAMMIYLHNFCCFFEAVLHVLHLGPVLRVLRLRLCKRLFKHLIPLLQ